MLDRTGPAKETGHRCALRRTTFFRGRAFTQLYVAHGPGSCSVLRRSAL
jgi:hypothetical protein